MTRRHDFPECDDCSSPKVDGTLWMSVGVSDLRVDADIGINPEEIGVLQELAIDLDAVLSAPDAQDIEDTVDYRDLMDIVTGVAFQRTGLIEEFARKVLLDCIAFPQIQALTIRIRKPAALSRGIARTELRWQRL